MNSNYVNQKLLMLEHYDVEFSKLVNDLDFHIVVYINYHDSDAMKDIVEYKTLNQILLSSLVQKADPPRS